MPDEIEARLVILGPEHPHEAKQKASAALTLAARILQERGTAPRIHANTLVFLAPDKARLPDLEKAVCVRIPETFCWLLVPSQPDPRKQEIEWQEIHLAGAEPLVERASKRLTKDQLLVTNFGGVNLRMELDRIPLWRGDHVLLRQLIEDFARYLYPQLGATVDVTMEIQATVPAGIPETVLRTLLENCRALRFTTQDFESE